MLMHEQKGALNGLVASAYFIYMKLSATYMRTRVI
jgi:hypothetical protein